MTRTVTERKSPSRRTPSASQPAIGGLALAFSLLALAPAASAQEPPYRGQEPPYRIYAGQNYRAYTNAELQRRVFELERAVMQLQQRIYNLETAPPVVAAPPPPPPPWTCRLTDAFGKTFAFTSSSRGQADAEVRQQCAANTNAMHCKKVECVQ